MKATAKPDQGVVCTPHPLATEAGLDILQRGGTAAEAAVAAGAVLTVVYPHFCGLGGDGVWMLSDTNGLRSCVLGIGQAAQAVPTGEDAIPQRGPGSMLTTAGLVPSWDSLLDLSKDRWQGRMPLTELLSAAITYATSGFPVSTSQGFWLDYRAREHRNWPGFGAAFGRNGTLLKPGATFCQPGLARILVLLATEGLESFRTGSVAAEIADGLRAAGSPITAADLAATRARTVVPLSLRSGDWTLYAPPPPTQGATTLLIQGLLDRVLKSASGETTPATLLHAQVEATKQAFLHRRPFADPDFSDQSRALPDTASMDEMARRISLREALPWPEVFQPADTVYLAVSDAAGRCVSGLQSTYFDWGSGVPVGDTGILWHNRGAAFDTNPGSPNHMRPGKRPFHTLNPGFAVKNSGETVLYGTQGADGQPQTLTVLLHNLLNEGVDVGDALNAPRFLLGRTFSDTRDTLKVEETVGADVLNELRSLGHHVSTLPPLSPLAGQAGAIRNAPDGSKYAGHDPRGDGTAGAV